MFQKAEGRTNVCQVVFDSYPDLAFPADLEDFTAIADARTQIYKAKFRLSNVSELNLLPGMSATVTVKGTDYAYRDGKERPAVSVPSSAAGVDEKGGYFVWKLEPDADEAGVFRVRKFPVSVVTRVGTDLVIGSGVKPGDRIATAGVSVLSEGRKVSLLKESEK